MLSTVSGIQTVPFETLCAFHPGFALAIANGVECRPNLRTLQFVFSDFALNVPNEESFDQQITGYSVFSGVDVTLDPTNAFPGNLFGALNDVCQAEVTGITARLMIRSRDEHDYWPIPVQTPLQSVPKVLGRSAGIWALNSPDNAKMDLTLISTPNGDGPLTAWVIFSLLVLGEGATPFLCMSPMEARAQLRKMGYGPCCPPGGVGA